MPGRGRPRKDSALAAGWSPQPPSDGRVEDLALNEWVFQALGSASMCWEHPERAGVFDSTRAAVIGDVLMAHLYGVIAGTRAERTGLLVVTTPEQVGEALRDRRRSLGWPLRVVGDRAGMTLQQVHELETGKVRPRTDTLLRVAAGAAFKLALLPDRVPVPFIYRLPPAPI